MRGYTDILPARSFNQPGGIGQKQGVGNMSEIHILHENSEWTAPLIAALEARGLPYRD